MSTQSDSNPFTFWDEEKQISELHWRGHVLTGTNEATLALMEALNKGRDYRQFVASYWTDISRQLEEFMRQASHMLEAKP